MLVGAEVVPPYHHLLPACYPNGTVTAVAIKVESVATLDSTWLTLRDQSCRPVHSDDRFAFFTFTVDSCGTTRKVRSPVCSGFENLKVTKKKCLAFQFAEDYIIYENQISQSFNPRKGPTFAGPADSKYR